MSLDHESDALPRSLVVVVVVGGEELVMRATRFFFVCLIVWIYMVFCGGG